MQTYIEIQDTFNALGKTSAYIGERWPQIVEFFGGRQQLVFTGCGSSYSLAKSMAIIARVLTGRQAYAMASGDMLLHAGRYAASLDGACVIAVSRSGRTSELLMALEALKETGRTFKFAAFICADGTPLEAISDLTLAAPWAFDESVCQTRSVTNFYYMAANIFARLADDRILLDDLQKTVDIGPEYMAQAEKLAEELSRRPWSHCVVLADAELEGIAEEGSLAFKEICQIPSSYHHLLDVRHGPIVLIGADTLVLAALGTCGALETGLLRDVSAKGAAVAAFTDIKADPGCAYISTFGSKLSHIAQGIPFILLCQLISYKKALCEGADPDRPAGLDSWIKL